MRKMELTFEDEGDDSGQLIVRFWADHFSGQGSAYFSVVKLLEEVDRMAGFPISEKLCPTIRGGIWSATDNSVLLQEHLFVEVCPADRLGNLRLTVRVSEALDDANNGLRCSATARFKVTYDEVFRFSESFRQLLKGFTERIVWDEMEIEL